MSLYFPKTCYDRTRKEAEGIEYSGLARRLLLFHMFRFMEEVQYKDILDAFGGSKKTAARDIRFLERAGVIRLRYSRQTLSFLPAYGARGFAPESSAGFLPPHFPEDEAPAPARLEKFLRLCTMMLELEFGEGPEQDPAVWYKNHYPTVSRRTMERDFAQLEEIEYSFRREFAFELSPDDPDYVDGDDEDGDRTVRRCNFPHSLEDVRIFYLPNQIFEGGDS